MKGYIRSTFCILLAAFMFAGLQITARQAHAAMTKTLTAGTASGAIGATVSVPLSVDNSTGIGGTAFTIKYNPAVFDFAGLELAGKAISDGSDCLVANSNPPDYSGCTAQDIANTMFYQVNDVVDPNNASAKVGQVLVAAASAQALTNNSLFKAKFTIKGGSGVYPIQLVRSIIQNADAGYTNPTTLPVFVGMPAATPNAQGYYDTPVFSTTLVSGSINVLGGRTISGKVTYGSAGGANADGSIVVLEQKVGTSYQFNAQAPVSSGAYSFANKPAGDYRITVVKSANPLYYPPGSLSVTLLVDQDITGQNFVLQAATTYHGTVKVNNLVLSGVRVKVLDANNNVLGIFPTDANGYFETSLLPPGTYTYYAVYGNQQFQITPGDTPSDWTLNLHSISGHLSGLPNGTGDVLVTASSATGKLSLSKKVTVSNAGNGLDYTISNFVEVNDVVVSAVTSGKPVQYYNSTANVTDVTDATKVDVSTADATGIDFDFSSGQTASISGSVSKDSSAVADGKAVYGFNVDTFGLTAAYTSGGNYTLNLAPGTYQIFVISNNRTFYYNSTATTQLSSEATPVTIAANDAVSAINIDLTLCNYSVSGYVTFANGGLPLANALITATGSKGQAFAYTNSNGRYTIGGLCAGSYLVDMNPLITAYAHQQQNTTIASSNVTVNFTIDNGYTLSGTVMDNNANGIAGALLYLSNADTGQLVGGRMYLSDNTGAYQIKDVPAGLYTLHVSQPNYKATDVPYLSIAADTTQDVTLTKDAYIFGTVDDGTNPLGGALVVATTPGQAALYGLTKPDGTYQIFGLDSTGNYLIMAIKDGYERNINGSLVTPSTSGTQIDFSLTPIALTFNLQGTVTDCNGAVANAKVIASYFQGNDLSGNPKYFFKVTTTDANGSYAFVNMPQDAAYQLVVIPGGTLRPATVSPIDGTVGGTVIQDVTINCGSTISGTVTLGATADTVYVVLFDSNGNFVDYQAISTANGTGGYDYSFENLATGNYKVLATATGNTAGWYNGQSTLGSATPVAAGTTGVDITLTAQ